MSKISELIIVQIAGPEEECHANALFCSRCKIVHLCPLLPIPGHLQQMKSKRWNKLEGIHLKKFHDYPKFNQIPSPPILISNLSAGP